MADKKITELNQLAQADVNAADMAAVADVSANETRKVSVPDLAQAGIKLMPDGSIPGAKLEDDAITSGKIADGAVGTDDIADDAVTTDKIADEAVTTAKIDDDAITSAKIKDGEVKLADLDSANYGRGLDKSADNVGITNTVAGGSGSFAGISYNDQGLITSVDPDSTGDVPRADLPVATTTEVGVVSIPTNGGLDINSTGALSIDNTVSPNTGYKITYNDHGLVTESEGIVPADLPEATTTTLGAVKVPATDDDGDTPLDIAADGDLTHATSGVTAGTYEKVTVNKFGHVTAGTDLVADDIPDLSADKITSGTLPVGTATAEQGFDKEEYTIAIKEESISRRHLNDVSTAYIQESQPTSVSVSGSDATVFRGCLWFKESTGQLYMYNGNAWHIVAGGQLTSENLRFMGTYNADTNTITTLTDEGTAEQLDGSPAFTVGSSVPACQDELSGAYFLIETGGDNIGLNDVNGETFTPGDLLLGISTATGWVQVSGAFGSGGGGGGGFWSRAGASPTAELTPTNAADNLDLQGGDWLALPWNSTTAAPSSGHEGTVRWNDTNNYIEVWDGSEWQTNAKSSNLQWETIANGDNLDWTQDIVRPKSTASDIAVRPNRSLVFENGTPGDSVSSGDTTCQLELHNTITASRTYTLPDETGTILTDVSDIDCGTY